MLDLTFVRDNLSRIEQEMRQRGLDPSEIIGRFGELDACRRKAITAAENLKAERNRKSEQVAQLKKNKQDATALIEETKGLREQIQEQEKVAEQLDTELRGLLVGIPNVPHPSVPVGSTSEDNQEVRRWGEPPRFDFTPKPHWELGEALGILDLERAAKLTGARFAVY